MNLTKPNQELRRDLLGLASDLKWSAVELVQIAGRLRAIGNEPDAVAVMRLCEVLRSEELRVGGMADEVESGVIERICQRRHTNADEKSKP